MERDSKVCSKRLLSKKNKDYIHVYGAREHNLKNIDVSIPKNTLTVITGPSGSGKSSLALDILYTEGKRRYMESLSSYARQFLGIEKKPEFDRIDGLCPSIAIEQKTVGSNPRSTVGTITEIYDYSRILFARIGKPHCPDCGDPICQETPDNITAMIIEKMRGKEIVISAPIVIEKKGEFVYQLEELFSSGMYRFQIDGKQYKFKNVDEIKNLKLGKTYKHSIDILLDAITVEKNSMSRLQESIEKSFAIAVNTVKISENEKEYLYSSRRMCLKCAQSFPELEPRHFSFNSPLGACKQCHGLGIVQQWPWEKNDRDHWKSKYPEVFGKKYMKEKTCHVCFGKRLSPQAMAVTVDGKNIYDLCDSSIDEILKFFKNVNVGEKEREIAGEAIAEIVKRLQFLHNVGLSYLTLNRTARTLSGGEGQRIRLATQIGSALSGVLYILDEPSIGLHHRDNDRLIETLKALRDNGNTVVVVEHDIDTIKQADHIIDIGPAAGIHGGMITATGTSAAISKNKNSLTGKYLTGEYSIEIPKVRRPSSGYITLEQASRNNLKDITVEFPLGLVCGISGVSGSGKSSLIFDELVPALRRDFSSKLRRDSAWHDRNIIGSDQLENMVVIDQSPIGRTPRSNPATYLGVFDEIRKLFSSLPESNARGYMQGRFSFNVKVGRCYECSGEGVIRVPMHFLPDVTMECRSCKGARYNRETLQIKYKGKSVADVLNMTTEEGLTFFKAHPRIAKRLNLLCDVGLDYLKLGQPSTTLSGGEAQRIKLVDELAKRGKNTLYVLDEPTTGLHNDDIKKLLKVLNTLVDKGNSMIVIEHNMDVLKTVDYLIDLGPEGGDKGGLVVAQGTPEEVAKNEDSCTGKYLRDFL
ncbi:excinuclease ABC subunit UvrA [bacterium]|jgi:excinuclease ABC subunit A|nr:excinuclease ABC subunit UvrA [bacterium]